MPIPHTLSGTIVFLVIVVFLMGMVDSREVQSQITGMGEAFKEILKNNESLGAFQVITTPLIFTGMIIAAPLILLDSMITSLFNVPLEINLFWIIIIVTFTVAIIKLARGVWDY